MSKIIEEGLSLADTAKTFPFSVFFLQSNFKVLPFSIKNEFPFPYVKNNLFFFGAPTSPIVGI